MIPPTCYANVPVSAIEDPSNQDLFVYPEFLSDYIEKKNIAKELASTKSELETAKAECERLKSSIDQSKSDFQTTLDRSHTLKEENKRLSDASEKFKRSAVEKENMNSELKSKREELGFLTQMIQEKETMIAALKDENSNMRAKVEASNCILKTVTELINPTNTNYMNGLMMSFKALVEGFDGVTNLIRASDPDIAKLYAASQQRTETSPTSAPQQQNHSGKHANANENSFGESQMPFDESFNGMFYDTLYPSSQ